MLTRTLTAALVFGAASLAPPAALSVTAYAPRDQVIEKLETRDSEMLVGGGLAAETHLLEVWSSAETGRFTLLLTQADGRSRIIAAGQDWYGQLPPDSVVKPGIAG